MSEKKEAKKAKKAAKKAAKGRKGDKGFKVFIAIILVIAIIGELYIGITLSSKLDTMATTVSASSEEGSSDSDVTFTPDTYAGVEFKTLDDVVNYYNDAYNKTKAKSANYKNSEGSDEVMYDFIGEENLTLKENSLLVDGSSNAIVNKMVPGILGNVFKPNIVGLPPSANRHPENDVDSNGEAMLTSRVTVEDLSSASVEEVDGKIKLTLVPVATEMSTKGLDSQGHFFNSLGALDSVIESIGVITWASGSTSENVKATYEGGKAVVTIDPASGEIVEADYNMVVNVSVVHATITALKDKSASLTILYDNHFPASDEFVAKKEYTRA